MGDWRERAVLAMEDAHREVQAAILAECVRVAEAEEHVAVTAYAMTHPDYRHTLMWVQDRDGWRSIACSTRPGGDT